jgi:hypothetical protein
MQTPACEFSKHWLRVLSKPAVRLTERRHKTKATAEAAMT